MKAARTALSGRSVPRSQGNKAGPTSASAFARLSSGTNTTSEMTPRWYQIGYQTYSPRTNRPTSKSWSKIASRIRSLIVFHRRTRILSRRKPCVSLSMRPQQEFSTTSIAERLNLTSLPVTNFGHAKIWRDQFWSRNRPTTPKFIFNPLPWFLFNNS